MLEEIVMDKKLVNRTVQSPKGVVETKKNQDVTVGKSFPKLTRKREKPGQKVEYLSKKQANACQKSKHHGRKSGPKPSYHDVGGKNAELACLDEDFDTCRSKKQNLAHLLNFHCKPRGDAFNTSSRRSTPKSLFHNTIRTLMSTQKHKYNKEQFLQANCQFVIRSDADYSVHLADPDILVDWNLIEQILVSSFEPVTCPICLEFPTAGKITRCGHIYCWSCILHYLSLTDKSWHKCPICFEAIHNRDLKSVKLLNQKLYTVGDEINFRLMKREDGSTIAIPVLEINARESNVLLPVSGSDCTTVYSKLLEGSYQDILKIIEIEEIELNNELKENEGCPEICFVEQSLQLLNERRERLFKDVNKTFEVSGASCSSANDGTVDEKKHTTCDPVNLETSDGNIDSDNTFNELPMLKSEDISRKRNESVSAESDGSYIISVEDLEIPMGSPSNTVKEFFFYQAEDGQQIFLHSLNARMLERQFGSLERSPSTIKGTIVEIETGSMTEELRKRLRYLQHLPVTCQFQVVEIKFLEPAISEEHLTFFKDQLEKRTRQREKRVKEEQRLEKKAQQLARKQFGNPSPPRRLRLDSLHHFPECGSDTPPNLSPSNRSPASSRTSSPQSSASRRSTSPITKTLDSLSLNNKTFAQKLKESNKEGAWKKRTAITENEAGSSHSRNLISDAVEAALIKARIEKEADKQDSGKGKKKKKQKQIRLCSMGMVYGNR